MADTFLLKGLALGFGNGIAPGPFLALVIAASLRGGFRNGAVLALSPLITDLPIIAASMLVLAQLASPIIGGLSMVGALVLGWYAYEAFRDARSTSLSELRSGAFQAQPARHALREGIVANAVNPNPWMFWITVGGPLLSEAWSQSPLSAAAFVVPFYGLLIGSKVAVAAALGAGRTRLSDRGYRVLLSSAGLLLVALAFSMARSGVAALV